MSELEEVLRGLTVLDLGLGMSPALVTKLLVEAGARVIRLEPAQGDPFYDIYPAYRIWQNSKEIEAIEATSAARLDELLASSDICVLGGEDYPGLNWHHDAQDIAARHSHLTILNITGYPASLPFHDRPASDILTQARSGLCFEHYSDKPYVVGFASSIYGAALLGLTSLLAAFYAKLAGGGGQIASVSLLEGSLSWCLPLWMQSEKPDNRFNGVIPKDTHPLIFRCKDGKFIHLVLGSAGSKGRVYRILKIDDPAVSIDDSGFPNPTGPAKMFFGDVETLAAHVAQFDSDELITAITAAEVAVEFVLPPGECWSDPQVIHNAVLRGTRAGDVFVGAPITMQWQARSDLPLASPPDGAPLGGLRVLDFGTLVAGPYGTVPLADLGADVIKVEPLSGDILRVVPRNFIASNRGKRSIAVDMKSPEGAEIVRRLCESAAAVTNNFRPGVSARLGIDPGSLQKLKPGIVVLEMTGYGSSGPRGLRPGYDMVLQAFCGYEVLAGGEGNPPFWNRTTMLDFGAALCGTVGMLLALIHRQRTGSGASVQTSILNAGLFMLSELIKPANGEFAGARPLNRMQTGFHPAEAIYQTADGWIALHAPTHAMACALWGALELDGKDVKPRDAWAEPEYTAIGQAVRLHATDALCKRLDAAGVWAEPVLEDGNVWLNNEILAATGAVAMGDDKKYGRLTYLGQMFELSKAKRPREKAVPSLGADTKEILLELGYSTEAIEDLYARKIVA